MGEKQAKCFVPECNNTVGVLFPKNWEGRMNWLKALMLEDLLPDPKSFICLDHFEENGHPGIRSANCASHPDEKYLTSQQKTDTIQETQVHKSKDSVNLHSCKAIEHSGGMYSKYDKTCRLCMVQSPTVKGNVYNKLDEKYTIAQAITICLYPLKVLPNDALSKYICIGCKNSLREYIKFYERCIESDTKLRKLISSHPNEQRESCYANSEHSDEYLYEERLSDYEENMKYRQDNGIEQIGDESSVARGLPEKGNYVRRENECLKVSEGHDDATTKEIHKKLIDSSGIDKIQDNDILEYTSLSKDDGYTEDIIIEMVNDESTTPISPLPDTSRLPITIKRIGTISSSQKSIKRRREDVNNSFSKRNVLVPQSNEDDGVVILPRGISVEVKGTYQSPLGYFSSEQVEYFFNHEYLLAGNYLYEFRLLTNNVRQLRCVKNNCPGLAHQFRIEHNIYLEDIKVVTPHNHEPPDQIERKRQMLYNILHYKMRHDKNFNFKVLYEQFCKFDSSLPRILPLSTVIKEICRKRPSPKQPVLKTFHEFYDNIESDHFYKVHFTSNRIQFYQGKFQSEDGAKAVVFGDQQVIEQVSVSTLMYVDASFVIESDHFPYQLVTVLVWMDQSYYPIFYAFISMKSQDLYKKIFDFLYNEFAPCLRPQEIITDYEANIYYALGETYVESSIGGSVFYFAQNIYKKICALDLARELELNSNFRKIYNMILMLPLLPVNTIIDGLNNIEIQAKELNLQELTEELFLHVRNEWLYKVTPQLFCVHKLENRVNENVMTPFKKLRDLLTLSRNKIGKFSAPSIIIAIEKLIELEKYVKDAYGKTSTKSFSRDSSSNPKKTILKAWNYIENHPMININHFFLKVIGYVKCMENQLWIWGFYGYGGATHDILIDASNFSIINENEQEHENLEQTNEVSVEERSATDNLDCSDPQKGDEHPVKMEVIEEYYIEEGGCIRKMQSQDLVNYANGTTNDSKTTDQQTQLSEEPAVLMEAVINEHGRFVLKEAVKTTVPNSSTSNVFV